MSCRRRALLSSLVLSTASTMSALSAAAPPGAPAESTRQRQAVSPIRDGIVLAAERLFCNFRLSLLGRPRWDPIPRELPSPSSLAALGIRAPPISPFGAALAGLGVTAGATFTLGHGGVKPPTMIGPVLFGGGGGIALVQRF